LPIAGVCLPIAGVCLPIAEKGISYTVVSGAAWSASVCGCCNIAALVHAASVKPWDTHGHSRSVSAVICFAAGKQQTQLFARCWGLLLPELSDFCLCFFA
jgi:hypothetical protein